MTSTPSTTRTEAESALLDSEGAPLPSWRDRSVQLLLVLVFALQAVSWRLTDGYQIADSVEFLERARTFVRHEQMIDAGVIRPFGFSTVVVPFFTVADWFHVEDQRPVVWAVCLLQMALGLALVLLATRLGARLCGRRGGLLAGFLVGTNPVFLQYSTQLVSGIAAGVCVGMALERLIERGGFRRSLAGGLWLGAGFLMAYQSLLIVLALFGLLVLRDGRRHRHVLLGVAAGFACAIGVQIVLDWGIYGKPGASLWNYLLLNVGSGLASLLYRTGFTSIAKPLYATTQALLGQEYKPPEDPKLGALQSPRFYLQYLPRMLVWPAIAALALSVVRTLDRPSWKSALLLLTLVANVFVMSLSKGSKEFRLWLPLLPFLAPLCAYGWLWLARGPGSWRRVLSFAFVASTLALSVRAELALNTQRFGGYWKGIEFVNDDARASFPERAAAAGPEAVTPRMRVGSAYNWAVYMRESPLVQLVKLPWQLNLWERYTPEQRAADLAALGDLDVFVTHEPILGNHLDLLSWVNEHFEVAAALYDQRTYQDGLGPIFVLVRRTGRPEVRSFFSKTPASTARPETRFGAWPPTDFVQVADPTRPERLVLLDWRYETLPPEGHGWITYRWTTPTGFVHDYTLLDRITSPDEHDTWQNNHKPAYGVHPTPSWEPGAIVTESYLVVPAAEAFKPGGPWRPLGGAYRRGDLIPVRLWMQAVDYDPVELEQGRQVARAALEPARPGADAPIRPPGATEPQETPDGIQFSKDGMVRVGAFFLPVPASARLPDDGKPILE